MKTIQSLIVAAFFAAAAQAAGNNLVECNTQHVADGGYEVNIHYIQRSLLLEADVYENSFVGRRLIATVPVQRKTQIDTVRYTSTAPGQALNLYIDYNRNLYEDTYESALSANLNGKAIPPANLPGFGKMACHIVRK